MAGFWQNLITSLRPSGSAFFTPNVTYLSGDDLGAVMNPGQLTAAEMWRSQPHFRTVVTFLARNVAQLGLHSFERVDNTDRRRDRSSVLARTLASPDGQMTTYELVFALVGDLALYDRAYWWAAPSSETGTGWMIRRLPPTWVTAKSSDPWTVDHYEVHVNGKTMKIAADEVLAFPGFDPTHATGSSPTVEALRQTLQEQVEAAKYRGQVWKRGGRVSSILERPADAPAWTDEQAERFREDWYAKYTGKGSRAGGTPILEDGMKLTRVDFNAQEQQFVEAAKLSLVTVAAAFHINPTMVGQNDGANYSNVREFRKMLYGDTLGPILSQVEGRINTFLVSRMGLDPATHYVEFNIDEKLQGNFEEQSAALQSATGAPWMTRNEARSLRNLPALEGGDELITPLNVLVGGQASPNDSGAQNRTGESSGPVSFKARPVGVDARAADLLGEFFSRQSRTVLSRLGAGSDDWWDKSRWDDELGTVLNEIQTATASTAGRSALRAAGIDPDRYDDRKTVEFLAESAHRSAVSVNEATREAVVAAEEPSEAFDTAKSQRAAAIAAGVTTFASGFAAVEAANQAGSGATKTWVVTSSNPRDSHAAMNGETVPVDDVFSNGLRWPGATGDADETAGCMCDLQINFPDSE